MAKSKKMRRQQRLTRLQEKLLASGQLKQQQSNSVVVERMKTLEATTIAKEPVKEVKEMQPTQPEPTPEPVMEEKAEETIEEVREMVEELMSTQIIEKLPLEPEFIATPMDLMKLKKSELLSMAQDMGCDVSSKNTKKQIAAAIEKESA